MDKYESAIAFLKEHPGKLRDSWFLRVPETECLFQYLSMDGKNGYTAPNPLDEFNVSGVSYGRMHVGGLTEVHNKFLDFYPIKDGEIDEELMRMIMQDSRIPDGMLSLDINSLEIFAEWQRLIDKRWGRK